MGRHGSHSQRNRFSWTKLFLIILAIVCFVAIIWTAYLLYRHQIDLLISAILLAAAIGTLIWIIKLLNSYRVSSGVAFTAFFVTAIVGATILAFSGIEPLANVKNEVMTWTQTLSSQVSEKLPSPTGETISQENQSAPEYSAQISGHVVVTDKVIAYYKTAQDTIRMELTPPEGNVWWVVDITVKNVAYKEDILSSYGRWAIEASSKDYYAKSYLDMIPAAYPINVAIGQTGQTTFRFPVPDNLMISETRLVYYGNNDVSYGAMSGGEMVPAYDWDSKTVIREPIEDYIVFNKHMLLRTIASWQGSEQTPIRFDAGKSPWVVNWSYDKVSAINTTFGIVVVDERDYDGAVAQYGTAWPWGLAFTHDMWGPDKYGSIVVPRAGRFVIMVDASGINWWVKVGVE